ncbi:MAG: HIT domain-containing protein [Thermotogae bacterium]|nr:HIT domain-containing protein [Thermotogota bacterium]
MECVFCRIAKGEEKARIIYESEKVLAFPTIRPEAEVHILVIPKEHYERIDEIDDPQTAYELFKAIREVARMYDLKAFRVVNKNGASVGQTVMHVHIHVLSGKLPHRLIPKD